jgi:hypothetical protein
MKRATVLISFLTFFALIFAAQPSLACSGCRQIFEDDKDCSAAGSGCSGIVTVLSCGVLAGNEQCQDLCTWLSCPKGPCSVGTACDQGPCQILISTAGAASTGPDRTFFSTEQTDYGP